MPFAPQGKAPSASNCILGSVEAEKSTQRREHKMAHWPLGVVECMDRTSVLIGSAHQISTARRGRAFSAGRPCSQASRIKWRVSNIPAVTAHRNRCRRPTSGLTRSSSSEPGEWRWRPCRRRGQSTQRHRTLGGRIVSCACDQQSYRTGLAGDAADDSVRLAHQSGRRSPPEWGATRTCLKISSILQLRSRWSYEEMIEDQNKGQSVAVRFRGQLRR